MDNWERTYDDSDMYKAIQRFYSRFVEIITGTENNITDDEGNIEDTEIPIDYVCPISKELMQDPVVAADGYSYDRKNISDWFSRCNQRSLRSPVTGGPLKNNSLTDNNNLRSQISSWLGNTVTPQSLLTSNSDEQVSTINLKINVISASGRGQTNYKIAVPRRCTVAALKIAIIRKSKGVVNPSALIFGASYLNQPSDQLEKYRINENSTIICRCNSNSTIDVKLNESTFSCLRSETVASILFRNWLYSGGRPSSVQLWYNLQNSGDNWQRGQCPKDSGTSIIIHTNRSISSKQC